MPHPAADRRRRVSKTLLLCSILALAAAAVSILAPSFREGRLASTLFHDLSAGRVSGGRFFNAPAQPFDASRYRKALAEAELSLVSAPASMHWKRVQALVDAGTGKLQEAADTLRVVSESDTQSADLLNDLGVLYLGLGKEDPTNYFRALSVLQRSKALAPRAEAPRFNLVLTYRRAHLDQEASAELHDYAELQPNSLWIKELSIRTPTVSELLEKLQSALAGDDLQAARKLVDEFRQAYRRVAVENALAASDPESLDKTMVFILDYLQRSHEDSTIEAILTPLRTRDRASVVESRELVRRGMNAYSVAKLKESLQFYDQAEAAVKQTDSVFDALWIKLHRADAELRRDNLAVVRSLVNDVVVESRNRDFKWLLGLALTTKGADSRLDKNYVDSLRGLQEAVDVFLAISSPDAVRPLYYLATAHSLAANPETSLQLAYAALDLTEPHDHIRLAQLYWLAGFQLYKMGFEQEAVRLERYAVAEGKATGNPAVVVAIAPYLAMVDVANHDFGSAAGHLSELREMSKGIEDTPRRIPLDLTLNLLCAQIKIATRNPAEAERCLTRNLELLSKMPVKPPDFYASTLLRLAQVQSLQGRVEAARQSLRNSVSVVEENDTYLAADSLRMSFENERRNLYEAAIAFEYDHDGRNAAWSYVQRYSSKLFLEFLKQMNPGIARIHSEVIERDRVQKLIPANLQVLEYFLLEDRLLIWLVSNDSFESVSVPVSRATLERDVAGFLEATQGKGDVRQQAESLHRLLITPVEGKLDPKRALAIIPDQALHRLNFRALSSAGSYLIQRYVILDSPNLTTLLADVAARRPDGPAVAFGARTDTVQATQELLDLGKLYGEMERFNGDRAFKSTFLYALDRAAIFHYAGHSQDASDPLRSAILMDGELEGPNSVAAVDIAQRRMLSNAVVVLASCDSSVGNSRDGVGMRGLTSAFLISGAGSVVGSLWLVESESTSKLVLAFHRNLIQEHLSVAEALRKAQLDMIAEGVHPRYWSAFVVTGNTTALN